MVFPGMVYISHPTEYGTLYLNQNWKSYAKYVSNINFHYLWMVQRLGYGLMSDQSDMTIKDIAKYCDVFYIGGTKIGALCGEANCFYKE